MNIYGNKLVNTIETKLLSISLSHLADMLTMVRGLTLLFLEVRSQRSRLQWKAKSRKYQGVFEEKSRVKTWQVRGIWSQQLEHKQVPQ